MAETSGNPFADGSISFPGNPFASDDELAISIDDAYLLRGTNGNWYLSSDNTASDQDTLLFNSANPFASDNLPFPILSFATDASA